MLNIEDQTKFKLKLSDTDYKLLQENVVIPTDIAIGLIEKYCPVRIIHWHLKPSLTLSALRLDFDNNVRSLVIPFDYIASSQSITCGKVAIALLAVIDYVNKEMGVSNSSDPLPFDPIEDNT